MMARDERMKPGCDNTSLSRSTLPLGGSTWSGQTDTIARLPIHPPGGANEGGEAEAPPCLRLKTLVVHDPVTVVVGYLKVHADCIDRRRPCIGSVVSNEGGPTRSVWEAPDYPLKSGVTAVRLQRTDSPARGSLARRA